jgi:hypothetical protein
MRRRRRRKIRSTEESNLYTIFGVKLFGKLFKLGL